MSEAPSEAELAREEEISDIRRVMATVPGRRFMWRILAFGGIFSDIGPASADRHNYMSGRRGLALQIYNDVRTCDPDAFRKMEFENTELLAAKIASREKARGEPE